MARTYIKGAGTIDFEIAERDINVLDELYALSFSPDASLRHLPLYNLADLQGIPLGQLALAGHPVEELGYVYVTSYKFIQIMNMSLTKPHSSFPNPWTAPTFLA